MSTSEPVQGKWKSDAHAPVLFFIDDLSNRWVDENGDGIVQTEEDYGYLGDDQRSAFSFLEDEILSSFPEVRITFFMVTGPMSPANNAAAHLSHSYVMNRNEPSRQFFTGIAKSKKYELAYHGYNHGKPGEETRDFVQEWSTYDSLEEAEEGIGRGIALFRETVGFHPNGGKYCGYISNEFSDESIDRMGFKWWCRFYNRAAVRGKPEKFFSGIDKKAETAYTIKKFGNNGIIDIPTTIPGNLLNSVISCGPGLKGFFKRLLRPLLVYIKLREIRFLIKNGLVVSIQEHICPSRGDGRRQTPNIFDDKESLKAIFRYLIRRRVWFCTCTELADWILEREQCE